MKIALAQSVHLYHSIQNQKVRPVTKFEQLICKNPPYLKVLRPCAIRLQVVTYNPASRLQLTARKLSLLSSCSTTSSKQAVLPPGTCRCLIQ